MSTPDFSVLDRFSVSFLGVPGGNRRALTKAEARRQDRIDRTRNLLLTAHDSINDALDLRALEAPERLMLEDVALGIRTLARGLGYRADMIGRDDD